MACMPPALHTTWYGRSMSTWYASYWNAFLLFNLGIMKFNLSQNASLVSSTGNLGRLGGNSNKSSSSGTSSWVWSVGSLKCGESILSGEGWESLISSNVICRAIKTKSWLKITCGCLFQERYNRQLTEWCVMLMRHYIRGTWILMRWPVGLTGMLGLSGNRCISMIPWHYIIFICHNLS